MSTVNTKFALDIAVILLSVGNIAIAACLSNWPAVTGWIVVIWTIGSQMLTNYLKSIEPTESK